MIFNYLWICACNKGGSASHFFPFLLEWNIIIVIVGFANLEECGRRWIERIDWDRREL